jgi:hypothetical protein
MVTDDELREEAKKRVTKRRDLGTHAVVFTVVNAMIVGMWALTGGGYFWPGWIIAIWGIGLIMNVWDVYFRRPVTEHDIERELKRLQR